MLEAKRKEQQVKVGQIVGRVRGYLERFSVEAGAASGAAGEDEVSKAATKRAARTPSANQAALDGETIVLLKGIKEAILEQPHATMTLAAMVKAIDTFLDKAKAQAKKAA